MTWTDEDEMTACEAAVQIASTLGCGGEMAWSWEEVRARLSDAIATAIRAARESGRAEGRASTLELVARGSTMST